MVAEHRGWSDLLHETSRVEFTLTEVNWDVITLLYGVDPREFATWSDEEREARGWVRVPENDPDYDMDYCAWRVR